MKRAALVLLVVPLVALWLYGCDKAENPLEAETQASETALFAPGGGKVKPLPLPTGCTAPNLVAKYHEASGEWVCAEDEVGAVGGGPAIYHARMTYDFGFPATWTGDLPAGTTVMKSSATGAWQLFFPSSVADCNIMLEVEEADAQIRPGLTSFYREGNNQRVHLKASKWQSTEVINTDEPLNFLMICPAPVS